QRPAGEAEATDELAREVLGVGGAAAIAEREHLPAGRQRPDQKLGIRLDGRLERERRLHHTEVLAHPRRDVAGRAGGRPVTRDPGRPRGRGPERQRLVGHRAISCIPSRSWATAAAAWTPSWSPRRASTTGVCRIGVIATRWARSAT